MKFISKSLFNEKENLIIYGIDANSKSSIISTIYTDNILHEKLQIFPVRINAFDFITSVNSNFLGITTY